MVNTVKLLELMSARMFHDLAGPIGAVNNSIDFFEEENQAIKSKAIELAKSSAHESVLRLKFFRQAYGNISDTEISSQSIFLLIEEFLEKSKITLKWTIPETSINSYIAKVLLNMVIIASNAMIYGGVLSFISEDNQFHVELAGKNLIFTDETKSLLRGKVENVSLTSTNVQVYYTFLMLKEALSSLKVDHAQDILKFIITTNSEGQNG